MTRKKSKPKSNKNRLAVNGEPISPGSDRVSQAGTPAQAVSLALNRFRPLLTEDEYEKLIAELKCPLPQAIRINPFKTDPETAIKDWAERYEWAVKPVFYEPAGWQVTSARHAISQTIEHRMGLYYIQDAASMLPPALFDFSSNPSPLILDMAASPGGKTTHLASRSLDRGLIIANDASVSRLSALRVVLQNWSAMNTAITNYPGERFGSWYPEAFDYVLLDAPCSMQGLRSTDSHPMRPITQNEGTQLAQRQIRLLTSAFKAARPGGQIVYSTCTLSPEEDEAVVDALLKLFPGMLQVEDISAHFPKPVQGIIFDGLTHFDPSVAKTARMWPHRTGTSGFFAALIKKTESLPGESQDHQTSAGNGLGGLSPMNSHQQTQLTDRLGQLYGFDFNQPLEKQALRLMQRLTVEHKTLVFAIPTLYEEKFPDLRFHTLGILLGEEAPDGFVISHEWVSRFGRNFSSGRFVLPDEMVGRWMAGEDLQGLALPGSMETRIVMVADSAGRNLGRGKIHKDRLKNLLPKRIV